MVPVTQPYQIKHSRIYQLHLPTGHLISKLAARLYGYTSNADIKDDIIEHLQHWLVKINEGLCEHPVNFRLEHFNT